MRMLAGFMPPSAGTARICGARCADRQPVARQAQLGFLPEGAPTYPEMTVTGFLASPAASAASGAASWTTG